MSAVIGAEWVSIVPVRVGPVPAADGTPECYVTVTEEDRPILRVDVYPRQPDCYPFQEAIIWCDNLIVGLGSYVHAISLADRSTVTVAMESYFGHLYPTPDYLLLASGERLFRMEPDRSILWVSEHLGIDGVIVSEPGPTVVRGEGEWDPPGGWQPFAVFAADGKPLHELALLAEPLQRYPHKDIQMSDVRGLVAYVDIDDTLVRSFGSKRIPMSAMVEHVRDLHREGVRLYAWSSGGADYARESAAELGIEGCFVAFLAKPNIIIDDQAPAEWRRLIHVHPGEASSKRIEEYRDAVYGGRG